LQFGLTDPDCRRALGYRTWPDWFWQIRYFY